MMLQRSKMARLLWPVRSMAKVVGGSAPAIVEEAGRHAGRLTGGAPRRAPAADGDAVAVEDQRAVGVAARPPSRATRRFSRVCSSSICRGPGDRAWADQRGWLSKTAKGDGDPALVGPLLGVAIRSHGRDAEHRHSGVPPPRRPLEFRLSPAENTLIRLPNTSVEGTTTSGVSWGHPRGLTHATTSRHGHCGSSHGHSLAPPP